MTKMEISWVEMTGTDEEKKWKAACQQVFHGLYQMRFIGHCLDANLEWFANEVRLLTTENIRPQESPSMNQHAFAAGWVRKLSKHQVVKVAYGQLMDQMSKQNLGRMSLFQFAFVVAWLQIDDNDHWIDEAWFN